MRVNRKAYQFRIFLVVACYLILSFGEDSFSQENRAKVALEDIERIILELRYIETPTGLASSNYRLTRDYKLSLGPEDYNKFYNHVDGLAKEVHFPRDSIVTGLFGLAPIWFDEGEKFMLWSSDGKMLFTLLRDLRGWESVLNIFAVWSFEADTLTLKCLSDSTLVSGLGYAWLKNICIIDSTAYVIIGETSGGDEGVYNRSVWFGYWQIPCDFRIFHRARCRSSLCEREQELEYRIDESSLTAEIIKRERMVLDCDEDFFRNTKFADWYLIEVDTLDFIKMTSDFRN